MNRFPLLLVGVWAFVAVAVSGERVTPASGKPSIEITPFVPLFSVTFSWDERPALENIVSYTLREVGAGPLAVPVTVAKPPATVSNLQQGSHTFVVVATNQLGVESPPSTPCVVAVVAPGAPINLLPTVVTWQ